MGMRACRRDRFHALRPAPHDLTFVFVLERLDDREDGAFLEHEMSLEHGRERTDQASGLPAAGSPREPPHRTAELVGEPTLLAERLSPELGPAVELSDDRIDRRFLASLVLDKAAHQLLERFATQQRVVLLE